jgi:hypothetical protein
MRLKDAASCSFDCFNIDLKERPDDTVSSIDLQRTSRSIKRTSPLQGRLSGVCRVSHNLHGRTLHLIIHVDISLGCAEVLVPGKLHDRLGRDAAVGELGNETASSAVAGCAFDAGRPASS